jgi:hypothetical protein
MSGARPYQHGSDKDEDVHRRRDRQMIELLNELRVALPGVQILFAFLLTLAFQSRFTDATRAQLWIYIVTLLLCACATALLIAPVALHRKLFRQGRKREVVDIAAKLAQAGLLMLFLAVCGAILFILDFLLDRALAIGLAAGVAVVFLLLWYVLPWRLSGRTGR